MLLRWTAGLLLAIATTACTDPSAPSAISARFELTDVDGHRYPHRPHRASAHQDQQSFLEPCRWTRKEAQSSRRIGKIRMGQSLRLPPLTRTSSKVHRSSSLWRLRAPGTRFAWGLRQVPSWTGVLGCELSFLPLYPGLQFRTLPSADPFHGRPHASALSSFLPAP
jgi:hypothetical protein